MPLVFMPNLRNLRLILQNYKSKAMSLSMAEYESYDFFPNATGTWSKTATHDEKILLCAWRSAEGYHKLSSIGNWRRGIIALYEGYADSHATMLWESGWSWKESEWVINEVPSRIGGRDWWRNRGLRSWHCRMRKCSERKEKDCGESGSGMGRGWASTRSFRTLKLMAFWCQTLQDLCAS